MLQLLAAALAVGLGWGCGSETDECISLPATCAPAFSTDFNTIYSNVFGARCGTGTGVLTCHGNGANQGSLTLAEPNAAFNDLLGAGGTHQLVIPGDPACSPLMARLRSSDPNVRMPKGDLPLGEGALCAIQSWIREGASR